MASSRDHNGLSYTPFPDLTGWRSSARERGSTSTFVHATHEDASLSVELLDEACHRMGATDAANLIIAAWVIVLTHLLSQEDDIDVNVYVHELVHLRLCVPKNERKKYPLSLLLLQIQQAKASHSGTLSNTINLADNAVSVKLSKESISKKPKDTMLFFSANISSQDTHICLNLQASSMVHNSSSAQLHLAQVATCLKYILCEATPASPTLSLQYFATELLAGDNPLPEPLMDDIENIEYERFEHQMERVVGRYPTKIALDFRESLEEAPGNERAGNYLWSYQEINRRACIISNHLRLYLDRQINAANSTTPIVALFLEKSPFTYLAILAVLKSGAAWCPIDTDWPISRKKALLAKSGAKVVLTAGERVSSEIPPNKSTIIKLDSLDYSKDSCPTQTRMDIPSDELAYLIWTSGTTGLPKSVGIQHKSAVQALRSLQKVIPHNGSNFRYLQFSAYNFDLMILDVFYTWGLGGTLCSSSRSLLLTKLVDLSNAFQVTHTLLTPAVLAMTPRQSIPSLKVVINGGEKLSQIVADTWSIDCCLLNLYGPAEATLIAMHRRVLQSDSVKAPNIGRALPTTSCHAADSDDQIVLKGAVGQLLLGGHQCALGYIGEEDKTREHFIEHPHLGRVYKTGDLVRQLWNSEFEYLGRSDDQIKVNGIRIELLEINNVLRSALEQVKDSETLVIKSKGDDKETQLVNFSVVPPLSEGENVDVICINEDAVRIARQLTHFAVSHLPSYMIPSLFIIVSHFPRTSSAKVDREALRKALKSFNRLDWLNKIAENGEKPLEGIKASPQETLIRSHLAQLCDIDENAFGRQTTFPSLGLTSIKAITLSHRLMQDGISASVVDIVQCQTLASLAERISNVDSTTEEKRRETIAYLDHFDQHYHAAASCHLKGKNCTSSVQTVLPVTPLQEALLSETIRDKSRYWLHRAYNISPEMDLERLKHAIRAVVERTDIFRTCFLNARELETDSSNTATFVQVVLSHFKVKIVVIEEDIAAEKSDQIILKHVDKLLALETLGTEPPIGFLITKGKELQLIAVLHHALYDQSTLELMEDAITKCYDCGSKVDCGLEPFTVALQHLLSFDENEEKQKRKTWKKLLSNYPKGHAVSFPNLSGQDAISNQTYTSRYSQQTSFSLDKMNETAKHLQTSIRPILQAAWAAVFCAHCDTSTFILGDSISERTVSMELSHVAGPLLDTLPIPICIDSTYRKVVTDLEDFHKQAISSLPVPLRHVRSMVAIPHDFPLFSSVFVFEPPNNEVDQIKENKLLQNQRDFGLSVEHSVAAEVTVNEDGFFTLGLVVKDAVVASNYAKIILSQWESAISQAMTQPDSFASDFNPHFFPQELLSISYLKIPDSLDLACKTPVFTALSKWAIDTPNAVAVEFYSSLEYNNPLTKTYRELEQESTNCSHILKEKIAAKSVVAVSLHRSIETYILLLGILKAGLTYLPIDPILPVQRKNDLIKYSNAACIVWSVDTQWPLDQEAASICIIHSNSISLVSPVPTPLIDHSSFDMTSPSYIIFTSGSTGTPKGCVLSHRNLSSAIEAFRLTYEEKASGTLNQTTRFLARSVEAFDVAILEALLPLQVGGAIVTAPRNIILQDMVRAMQIMKVTHAAVVPSLFYKEGRRIIPADLPCLRALIVGGERVTQDLVTSWTSSKVPLLNAYGPSEACIGTSIAHLSPQDSTGNIGAPFPGTQYIVLKSTSDGFRVAIRGEAGELCIGGLQIGSYLSEGDSASFITWNGQRIYRTGDQVRLRKDDITEYLGRSNNGQVKLRGVRIELSEIDGVLAKASKLIQFCFTRVYGELANLITFISQKASSQMEGKELQVITQGALQEEARRLLLVARERLPSYMVPRIIVPLEHIPLSSISGKIDGKRLDVWFESQASKLLQSSAESEEDNQRELSKAESIVKEEIQRLLAIETYIGPLTDVFSLGLDSLNVISLSNTLGRRGLQVDISYIMTHSTVEAIAKGTTEHLQTQSKDRFDYTKQAQKESKLDISSAFPLPSLQESMITQSLIDGEIGKSHYINIIRLACKGKRINRERLEISIEEVLSSHQIYRTVFIELDGRIVQAILKEKPTWRLAEVEFEAVAIEEIKATLHRKPPLRYCVTQSSDVIFAVHHALYDGESLAELLEEISKRYNGKLLDPVEEFADFVRDIHNHIMEDKLVTWKDILSDSSMTHFPCLTGEMTPKIGLEKRLSVEHRPSISLTSLKQLARQEKVTLQLFIIDAFARLYARYVDQKEQVTFGLVLGGRSNGRAKVHGPCINTVPFSHKVETKDWKKRLQSTYAAALSNQHISLPGLARMLQVQGSLFNTLFSYLGPIKSNDLFQETSSYLLTEYPFALEVQELPESNQIEFRAVFDPEYIPSKQAELFLLQLESLLSSSSASPPEGLLMAIENKDPVIPDLSAHFLVKFASQVEQQPDSIAFVFSKEFSLQNEQTTYRQLDDESTAMASELLKIQGKVIGALLKQSLPLYPLLLAIWKAGKVYLPLDPSLPLERLAYMVSVAKPACIVSSRNDLELAGKLGSCLCVDDLLCCQLNTLKSEIKLDSKEAAYIMFTSGSSGTPKGVQISHLALAAAIFSWSKILPYTLNSRILQLASPGFDVFLIEVCMPLALGFSFASAAKEDLLNDLEVTFSKLQLTMADLPAVLAATIRPDKVIDSQPLQWLMSGGDIIQDRVIEQWSKHGLINAWGPTETTIGNTLGFLSEKSSRSWVGKVYPTSSIYILDPTSEIITYRGCIGEIAVGGPQLADGYVGNKELTREKFIILSNGVRVYRTGDRGRLLYDGSLECLGRIDGGQVKINSQRVELREIELQLKRNKGILDAAVLYLEHKEMQSKQLVAFVVVEEESSHCNNGLTEFRQDDQAKNTVLSSLEKAREHLASYMIPSICLIVAGNQLPLTPNDKINSKQLQAVYSKMTAKEIRQLDPRSSQNNFKRDWTKLEKEIRTIIADFCKVEEDEVKQDALFYSLGIDSISGFRLLKKLREKGFSKLSLRDILQSSTIALLATLIENQLGQNHVDNDSAILRFDEEWRKRCNPSIFLLNEMDQIKRLLPCTPLQEGLLLESLNSGLYVYHHFFRIEEASLESIIEIVHAVIRSYDILRTSFHLVDGQFIQAIHTNAPLQLPDIIETTDMEKSIMKLTSIKHFTEEVEFLKPLFAVNRLQSTKEGLVIIDFCLHHALYDGETLEMLFGEIEARVNGNSVPLRLPFEHLLPHLTSRKEDEKYIVNQVRNCQNTLLDSTGMWSSSSIRPCHYIERLLDIKMERLANFASQTGVSVHMVALYAFIKLLCHLTSQRDVVFAQLFSLRDAIAGAEDVMGPALNSSLTRVTLLDGEMTLNTLKRMQMDNDATRHHRRASMAKVLSLVRKSRKGRAVEFDTLFDFQRGVQIEDQVKKIMLPWELTGDTTSQYALNIQFRQQGNALSIVAVGDSNLMAQSELENHLKILEQLLNMTVKQSHQSSTEMPSGLDDLSKLPFTCLHRTTEVKKVKSKMIARDLTEEEEIILAVVVELSQLEKEVFDITTPINQLGLDSIMAIRLASLLRAKGLVLGVADVLQGKSVEGISRRIVEKKGNSKSMNGHSYKSTVEEMEEIVGILGIPSDQMEAILPLLPGQEFEFSEYIKTEGRSGIYTFLYKINCDTIDTKRLERAWKQLNAIHAILRTVFVICKGKINQVILSQCNIESWQSRILDGSMSALLQDESAWTSWIRDACRIDPFSNRPPNAACVVSAKDGFFFALRLHHALYDAWTVNFLIQELWHIYNSNEQKSIKVQKDDYAGLVKHLIKEKELLSGKAELFWKSILNGVLPCIIGDPSYTKAAKMATLYRPAILKDASIIEKRLRLKGISLGTAFIAAWSKCLLGLFSSHDKVVFGLYHRGRSTDFDGVETMASNCMNVLPLVIHLERSDTMPDLYQSIKDQMVEQTQFESMTSISDILSWIKSDESKWNTYLNLVWDDEQQEMDDSLQYLNQIEIPQYEEEEVGLEYESVWRKARLFDMKSDFNVNLHWNRKQDCVNAAIRYRSDIMSLQEVERIVEVIAGHFGQSRTY